MNQYFKASLPALGMLFVGVSGILLTNHFDDSYSDSSRMAHKFILGFGGLSILLACFGAFMFLVISKDFLFELKNSNISKKVNLNLQVLNWTDQPEKMGAIYNKCEQGIAYKAIEEDLNKYGYSITVRSWNEMVKHVNNKVGQ